MSEPTDHTPSFEQHAGLPAETLAAWAREAGEHIDSSAEIEKRMRAALDKRLDLNLQSLPSFPGLFMTESTAADKAKLASLEAELLAAKARIVELEAEIARLLALPTSGLRPSRD